jgi:hypothetical protein
MSRHRIPSSSAQGIFSSLDEQIVGGEIGIGSVAHQVEADQG